MLSQDGEKKIVILELDDEFITNLKRAFSLSLFDDSIKLHKNKVAIVE